jgi:hypothetical protein
MIPLQLLAALLAMLGGLMISADFIGVDRLNKADRLVTKWLTSRVLMAWDFDRQKYGPAQAIPILGRMALVCLVVVASIGVAIYAIWGSVALWWFIIGYGACATVAFTIQSMRSNLLTIKIVVLSPLYGLAFGLIALFELVFFFPLLRTHDWAKRMRIPSLVKLAGAGCVVLGFIAYGLSFFWH